MAFYKQSVNCKHLLTEAEEQCVDTHVVHTEESMGYEVTTKHHRLQKKKMGQNKDKIENKLQ